MTHPGKNVVLFNYVLEVTPKKYEEALVSIFLFFDFSAIIGICASYQYITIDWRPLQILGLAWICSSLLYAYFYFCESPKFLYNHQRFDECRRDLTHIARLNGISNWETLFKNTTFDRE